MTPTHDPTDPDVTAVWPSPPRAAADPEIVRWTAALLRDQAERWRAGHRRPVEAYQVGYPQLARHPEISLTLAASEFLIRADRGECPRLDEYHRRFPRWAGRLADEIAFLQRHGGSGHSPRRESGTDAAVPEIVGGATDHLSWPRLPGYELLAELGRGGMAVVYHARQTGLNRPVALKVILAGALAGASDRLRMRLEAEAVARLRHPNVIQIYDIGDHDGCLYLSLEYVAGGSLDRRLADRPLPPAEAARLVECLALAVQTAHDAGIIHRDLKPANVLLEPDGTPKVTDFGLAKQRDEARRLTATGVTAGTPSYMAPEQVTPEPEKIGPATDVYGLGAILYECLTGRPPFAASTSLATMLQVASEEVVSVRRLQPDVPRDLETICLKCLQKDPTKRYATARALADDLARFRAGVPILARPTGPIEQLLRWTKRNPIVPLLVFTLGLMTLSVAGLMAWSTYHAYQVAGHFRERELHLHGLRGELLRLDEAQARYADLAAAVGSPVWEARHRDAIAEADRHLATTTRLAPDATDLSAAAAAVKAREQRAMDMVRDGRAADAWQYLQSDEHSRVRDGYAAAVARFADRVDESADTELKQLQAEAFWSLASATGVAGLIGLTAVTAWLIYLR